MWWIGSDLPWVRCDTDDAFLARVRVTSRKELGQGRCRHCFCTYVGRSSPFAPEFRSAHFGPRGGEQQYAG